MKPEIRAALDEIGYATALGFDPDGAIEGFFERRGGLLFANASEARELLRHLRIVRRSIDRLPQEVREFWLDTSRHSDDWEDGRVIFDEVMHGLDTACAYAERYLEWRKRQPETAHDDAADQIAYMTAYVFVLGIGEVPKPDARDFSGSANGPYTRAVASIFKCLGVTVSFRKPCLRAVARLVDSGKADKLLALRRSGENLIP